MAVTVLSYKKRHVPVPESPVIALGYMLFHEAFQNATTSEERARFQGMTDDFALSTISGFANLLDEMLQGDPQKEAEFLALVNVVRVRLLGFGKAVPPQYVNQVMAIHEPHWKDLPWGTPWLHKVLDLAETLIRGGRLPPSDWLRHIRRGTLPSNRSHRKRR